jgi:hypothetical protein
MAAKGFNRFLPAFIPLAFEVMRHLRRDSSHNNNIKKYDKTSEKLSTIEHLMVRLEKKTQADREAFKAVNARIQIWLAINSVLLIAIVVKLFLL